MLTSSEFPLECCAYCPLVRGNPLHQRSARDRNQSIPILAGINGVQLQCPEDGLGFTAGDAIAHGDGFNYRQRPRRWLRRFNNLQVTRVSALRTTPRPP